jgi:hypothetical protein
MSTNRDRYIAALERDKQRLLDTIEAMRDTAQTAADVGEYDEVIASLETGDPDEANEESE